MLRLETGKSEAEIDLKGFFIEPQPHHMAFASVLSFQAAFAHASLLLQCIFS